MSVYKRPNSPFYYSEIDFRSSGGPRSIRSTETTSRREAEAFDREHRKEIRATIGKPAPSPITLDQACGKYWVEHGSRLRWASHVEWHLKRIVKHLDPRQPIADLSNADINKLVQARRAEGAGETAVNRTLAVLRAIHKRAGKLWEIDCRGIHWSSYMKRETAGRTRWLTVAEAEKLLAFLPDKVRDAVEWSIYTGTRRSETYGLKWSDVDLERNQAVVVAKGGREKVVLLSAEAREVLLRRPEAERDGVVFDRTNVRKIFEAGLEKAGIQGLTWHDLRHTHATWLRQAGAPLEVVQRSLGHTKVTTTQRYAHVDDGEVREALRKLPTIRTDTAKVVRLKR